MDATRETSTMSPQVEGAENYVSWMLAATASVVATLAAAVATLWKVNEARNTKMIDELKLEGATRVAELNADIQECREDRERIREKADVLSDQVARLEVRLAYLEQNVSK